MNALHCADPLGLQPWYYRVDRRSHGATVRQLLAGDVASAVELDRQGVQEWLVRRPLGHRTCFAAVRRVPAGASLQQVDGRWQLSPPPKSLRETDAPLHTPAATAPTCGEPLRQAIGESLRRMVRRHPRIAVALSGGLDSALLLALLGRLGIKAPVYSLLADWPGYHERNAIMASARWLSVEDRLVVVGASPHDFAEALPAAVRACETPLYNAHPVSKLLLARALKADGIDAVITGDGADEVFAGADGRDYLPLVGALFRAEGVALCTPFSDVAVTEMARQFGADPDKSALRMAAAGLVPPDCLARRKRPTLTPPLDIDRHVDGPRIQRLAAELSLPAPAMQLDTERMTWSTLSLLVDSIRSDIGRGLEEPTI